MNKEVDRRMNDDTVKASIMDMLSKAENPLSTSEIASELDVPWHSVQMRCLKLQIENLVRGFRVGRMNLWQIKKEV
jgi:Mn-dependent DtxR family transcriptional regulator